eukprot:COSAG05_NODE_195_length_14550_cov_203.233686_12_plen_98_part_00
MAPQEYAAAGLAALGGADGGDTLLLLRPRNDATTGATADAGPELKFGGGGGEGGDDAGSTLSAGSLVSLLPKVRSAANLSGFSFRYFYFMGAFEDNR